MPATLARPTLRRMIRPANPFAQGLIGCWTFREGAGPNIGDVSRNTHLGGGAVVGSNWSWGDGPWNANAAGSGGALTLNGTDAYVEVPTAGSALLAPQSLTIEAWAKLAVAPGAGAFQVLLARTAADYRITAGGSAGNWLVDVSGRGASSLINSGLAWAVGAWQHVVLRSVPGETSLTVNGTKAVVDTGTAAITYTTNGKVDIGARQGGLFWDGSVALTRMWERALSDAEVEALYADPWLPWARRSAIIDFAALAGVPPGSAALACVSTLSASGTATSAGSAALASASTLAASGTATASGSAALASVATLAAAGSGSASGSAALGSVVTLAASGSSGGGASLGCVATLTASGTATAVGSAALASVATLAAAGSTSGTPTTPTTPTYLTAAVVLAAGTIDPDLTVVTNA